VQQLLDHAAEGEFHFLGSRGAAMPGPNLFHFSVQDVHGVAAQGNDGGIHGPGLPLLLEGLGGAVHNAAGLGKRFRLFLRRGETHRFHGEEFNTVQFTHSGIEVMSEGKIDRDKRLPGIGPH
jgi:hypothetical protein